MTRITLFAMAIMAVLLAAGCAQTSTSTAKDSEAVERQQQVYTATQPTPLFDYSLDRQHWIDFYKARNEKVATWTLITSWNGELVFETPSQGYPVPMDTQLTNPLMLNYRTTSGGTVFDGVLEQPEPNGLFTSKNTDGTIVFAANDDGTLSPIYTELKATAFPFPVRWDENLKRVVRVEGAKPSISLKAGR